MVCTLCLSMFIWICDMAWLFRGTFVSWWFLPRIWYPDTDIQHYYLARYPTDDWHLANRFSLVYLFVVVYLRRLYHSVSSRSRPCTSVNAPPHRKECPHMHATTPPHHHYHYHADLLTCIEHIWWTILEACVNTCWVYSVKSVSKM